MAKRLLGTLLLILAFCPWIHGQSRTTVTGTVQGPTGVTATSGYVEFRIRPSSSSIAYRVTGTGIIAPQTARCAINGSGNVVGAAGVGTCQIWGTTTILPASLCYDVVLAPNNVVSSTIQNQNIYGASYDLSSPVFCPLVNIVPQYQTITTAPISANLVPAADRVFNLGDSGHYYSQAYIDNLNANILSNLTSLTVKSLNNIKFCDRYTGDAAAQINLCMADLLALGGGIADARGIFGGTIASASITFPAVPIHLLLGVGTYATSSITHLVAFTMSEGSIIEGQGMGATIIKTNGNGVNADGITPAKNAIIRNLTLKGNTTYTAGGESGIDGCACTGVEVDGVEITLFGGHGLNTGGNDANGNWNIHDSYIHDNHDDGLLLGGVGSHRVSRTRVWTNGSNGIDSNSANNQFSVNDIFNNGGNYSGTGLDCDGLLITSIGSGTADLNQATENRIRSNKCAQVRIRADASGHTNGTLLMANPISGGSVSAASVLIDTSVGAGCGQVNGTQIIGNPISGSTNQGILIGGGAGTPCTVNGTVVSLNVLSSNVGISIQVAYGTGATLAFNTTVGNGTDQPSLGGSTLNVECDRLGITTAVLNCAAGTLAFNTFQPSSGNVTTFQSTGNAQLLWHSSGGGSYQDWSWYIDNTGNFVAYGGAAGRIIIDSSGTVNAATAFKVGSGSSITKTLTGIATLDFPNTIAQNYSDLTIAVTGATDQDQCMVGPGAAAVNNNITYTCMVLANDLVTVRLNNYSAGAVNPASANFRVFLTRF